MSDEKEIIGVDDNIDTESATSELIEFEGAMGAAVGLTNAATEGFNILNEKINNTTSNIKKLNLSLKDISEKISVLSNIDSVVSKDIIKSPKNIKKSPVRFEPNGELIIKKNKKEVYDFLNDSDNVEDLYSQSIISGNNTDKTLKIIKDKLSDTFKDYTELLNLVSGYKPIKSSLDLSKNWGMEDVNRGAKEERYKESVRRRENYEQKLSGEAYRHKATELTGYIKDNPNFDKTQQNDWLKRLQDLTKYQEVLAEVNSLEATLKNNGSFIKNGTSAESLKIDIKKLERIIADNKLQGIDISKIQTKADYLKVKDDVDVQVRNQRFEKDKRNLSYDIKNNNLLSNVIKDYLLNILSAAISKNDLKEIKDTFKSIVKDTKDEIDKKIKIDKENKIFNNKKDDLINNISKEILLDKQTKLNYKNDVNNAKTQEELNDITRAFNNIVKNAKLLNTQEIKNAKFEGQIDNYNRQALAAGVVPKQINTELDLIRALNELKEEISKQKNLKTEQQNEYDREKLILRGMKTGNWSKDMVIPSSEYETLKNMITKEEIYNKREAWDLKNRRRDFRFNKKAEDIYNKAKIYKIGFDKFENGKYKSVADIKNKLDIDKIERAIKEKINKADNNKLNPFYNKLGQAESRYNNIGGIKGFIIDLFTRGTSKTHFGHIGGTKDSSGNWVGGVNGATIAAGMAVTAISKLAKSIINLGKSALASFGEIQSIKVNLGIVYGSQAQSADMFSSIKDYALRSPFGIQQVSEFAVLLKQSGVYSSELLDTLKKIGDVAGGNQEKYQRIANNYAQIIAANRATSLDLRQFANAGLPIYQEIRKELGISQKEVRKMTQEGKIGAEVIQKVFENMTSQGGSFYQAVNKGANTYKARIQNYSDSKEIAKAGIGEYIFNSDIFRNVLSSMEKMTDAIGKYTEEINNKNKIEAYKEELDKLNIIKEQLGKTTDERELKVLQKIYDEIKQNMKISDEEAEAVQLSQWDMAEKNLQEQIAARDEIITLLNILNQAKEAGDEDKIESITKILEDNYGYNESLGAIYTTLGIIAANIGELITAGGVLVGSSTSFTGAGLVAGGAITALGGGVTAGGVILTETGLDYLEPDRGKNKDVEEAQKKLDDLKGTEAFFTAMKVRSGLAEKSSKEFFEKMQNNTESITTLNDAIYDLYKTSIAYKESQEQAQEAFLKTVSDNIDFQKRMKFEGNMYDLNKLLSSPEVKKMSSQEVLDLVKKWFEPTEQEIANPHDEIGEKYLRGGKYAHKVKIDNLTLYENIKNAEEASKSGYNLVSDVNKKNVGFVEGGNEVVDAVEDYYRFSIMAKDFLGSRMGGIGVDEKTPEIANVAYDYILTELEKLITPTTNELLGVNLLPSVDGFMIEKNGWFASKNRLTGHLNPEKLSNEPFLYLSGGKKLSEMDYDEELFYRNLAKGFVVKGKSNDFTGDKKQQSLQDYKDGKNIGGLKNTYFDTIDTLGTQIRSNKDGQGDSYIVFKSTPEQEKGAKINNLRKYFAADSNIKGAAIELLFNQKRANVAALLNPKDPDKTNYTGSDYQKGIEAALGNTQAVLVNESDLTQATKNKKEKDYTIFWKRIFSETMNVPLEVLKELDNDPDFKNGMKRAMNLYEKSFIRNQNKALTQSLLKSGSSIRDLTKTLVYSPGMGQGLLGKDGRPVAAIDQTKTNEKLRQLAMNSTSTVVNALADTYDEKLSQIQNLYAEGAFKIEDGKLVTDEEAAKKLNYKKGDLDAWIQYINGLSYLNGSDESYKALITRLEENTKALALSTREYANTKSFLEEQQKDIRKIREGLSLLNISSRNSRGTRFERLSREGQKNFYEKWQSKALSKDIPGNEKTILNVILDNWKEVTERLDDEFYKGSLKKYSNEVDDEYYGLNRFENLWGDILEKSGLSLTDDKGKVVNKELANIIREIFIDISKSLDNELQIETKGLGLKFYQGFDEIATKINARETKVLNDIKTGEDSLVNTRIFNDKRHKEILEEAAIYSNTKYNKLTKSTYKEIEKEEKHNETEGLRTQEIQALNKKYLPEETEAKKENNRLRIEQENLLKDIEHLKDIKKNSKKGTQDWTYANLFLPIAETDLSLNKQALNDSDKTLKDIASRKQKELDKTNEQFDNLINAQDKYFDGLINGFMTLADIADEDLKEKEKLMRQRRQEIIDEEYGKYLDENNVAVGHGLTDVILASSDVNVYKEIGSRVLDTLTGGLLGNTDLEGNTLTTYGNNTNKEQRALNWFAKNGFEGADKMAMNGKNGFAESLIQGLDDDGNIKAENLPESFKNLVLATEGEEGLNSFLDRLNSSKNDADELRNTFADMAESIGLSGESMDYLGQKSKELKDAIGQAFKQNVLNGVNQSFVQIGQNLKNGESATKGMYKIWKNVGKEILGTIGATMTSTGLEIAAEGARTGNKAHIYGGLALAAAGGVASIASGLLSDSDDNSDKNSGEEQRIQNLKDALADLIDQAKTDAEYYEANLRHKKALASIDTVQTRSVNDAIITPNGNVVTTHPDDYLIATKTPDSLLGVKGGSTSLTINHIVNNMAGNVKVDQEERQNDDGSVDIITTIIDVVNGALGDGKLDAGMAAYQYNQKGKSVAM